MDDREHLLVELDGLENRQIALHQERAALDLEESQLLERKLAIRGALAQVALNPMETV